MTAPRAVANRGAVVGLLDLIKPKSALEKAAKAIREPYSQPEYRREAMHKLIEMGTDESYAALLQRFTFNSHGQIADEDEKNDLVEELVRLGDKVLPALKKFIETEKAIAFPIRALSRIVDKTALMEFLIAALKRYEPLDHRSTAAKTTLVSAIHDHGGTQHAPAVAPYLDDHHDDVQFQAIVALERFNNVESRDALANVCIGDTHSTRIQARAAQALADLEWTVKDVYDRFHGDVKSAFILSKKGHLVRKHGGAPAAS